MVRATEIGKSKSQFQVKCMVKKEILNTALTERFQLHWRKKWSWGLAGGACAIQGNSNFVTFSYSSRRFREASAGTVLTH